MQMTTHLGPDVALVNWLADEIARQRYGVGVSQVPGGVGQGIVDEALSRYGYRRDVTGVCRHVTQA